MASRDASTDRQRMRWLNRLVHLVRLPLGAAVTMSLLSGLMLIAQIWLFAAIVQRAVVDGLPVVDQLPLLIGLAAIIALRIALGAASDLTAVAAGETVKRSLRERLFADLMAPVHVADDRRSSGALAAALIEQVEPVGAYFARYLPAAVQASVLPVAFAVAVLPVDWFGALLLALTAPLIPVFMALVGWGAEAAARSQATAMARLAGRFGDRLRGLTTLKLYGRADAETQAIVSASEQLRQRSMGVLRIAFLSSAVLEFFAALGVAGMALYVGLSFLGLVNLRFTPLSLESGLFMLMLAPEVYQPLRLLSAHYHDRAAAKAALAEIETQFGKLPQALAPGKDASSPGPASRGAEDLVVRDFAVRTPDGARLLLERTHLVISAGDHLAIMGASGAGKTSLLEALAHIRHYHGHVTLGATDLADMPEDHLRARIAYLPQRTRMFHGTIAGNIRLGDPGASDAAIERAAQRAGIELFADRLPHGLATRLGEAGLGLSGGEIQRVGLARLYLRDPDVILLDEPTAHLDRGTEGFVLDRLQQFAQGRTLVVVTHSPVVAGRMDRVMRLVGANLLPAAAFGTPRRERGVA